MVGLKAKFLVAFSNHLIKETSSPPQTSLISPNSPITNLHLNEEAALTTGLPAPEPLIPFTAFNALEAAEVKAEAWRERRERQRR